MNSGGPLNGVRVLDTSSLAPGNYATLILARMGAEVIKLERPTGDPIRDVTGSHIHPFVALNAGKKSVVVDLKTASGQESFDRLVAISDVVVENYLPSTAERLRVTYERLKAVNSSVILCSITGYGRTSARYSAPGHDLNFWAESGALAFMPTSGIAPILPVSDMQGGAAAAIAISSALFERATSGRGDHVRVALTDAMLHAWVGLGLNPAAQDEDDPAAGYGVYSASDGGSLAVAVEEQHYWESFCDAIGQPELKTADHLANGNAGRALRERIQSVIGARPIAHWLAVLHHERQLPVNEVLSASTAAKAALSQGSPTISGDIVAGLIPQSLFTSSRFTPVDSHIAPRLGEHTVEFLG